MERRKHLESFGPARRYQEVILLVEDDRHSWRKIARLLNRTRRQLRPWSFVCRQNQFEQARNDVLQSLRDTRLTNQVKNALMRAMNIEFEFEFVV